MFSVANLILLAIVAAAGIWAILFALHVPILHACLALLIAVACFGPAFAKWELGPIAASPDRLAFLLLIGIAGLKRLVTWQPSLRLNRSDFVLAGLLLLLFVNTRIYPAPPHTSPRSPSPTYMFVASYFLPALVYWICRFRAVRDNDASLIQGFFLILGVYLAFTAICEAHGASSLIVPQYIVQKRLYYEGRSVGPFLSAPALGTWLTVATMSLVLIWFRVNRVARAALVLLFAMFAYAEYLTRTRSAWLGFVVAIPLAAVLSARPATKRVLIVGLIVGGIIFGIVAGERFLLPERKEGRGVVAYSTFQRLALFQKSLSLFVQRPLVGWGFGQFEFAARYHGGGGPLQLVDSGEAENLASHNLFLRTLAELGCVGMSLLVLLLGGWMFRAWTILKSATPGESQYGIAVLFAGAMFAYVSEASFHDVTFISQDHVLLFFLAGCLCSSQAAASEERSPVVDGERVVWHKFTQPVRSRSACIG